MNAIHNFPGAGDKSDWLGVLCIVALVVGAVLGVSQAIQPASAAHLRRWTDRQRAAGRLSAATVARVRAVGVVGTLVCLMLLILIVAHVFHV
jgi:hypothetical protein